MTYRTLFKYMLLEEWRLHTTAFGKTRFAGFPIQIFAFTALITGLLSFTGIPPQDVLLGIHAVVFLFGLHTGTTAFEGSDAMENVLGDITYLLFSTRTLPVSPRQLFGVFIVKDILYYSALFLAPMTVGVIPLYYFGTGIALGTIATLFVSLAGIFVMGAAVSVIAVRLVSLGKLGVLALGGVAAGVILSWYTLSIPVPELTFYGLHIAETWRDVGIAVLPTLAAIAGAVAVYAPTNSQSSRDRVETSLYSRFRSRVDRVPRVLALKTVVDIQRSSGGFLKVGVSAGILFVTTWFMLWGVETAFGIPVSPGVAFGTLLSLTAFTTYTWLTQYDDPGEYVFHPVSVADVFRAKYLAFGVVTIPAGVLFYGGGVIWQGAGLRDAVIGAVIFAGLSVYVLGLVVYLAGLDPNTFMFDTSAFAAFAAGVSVGVVPLVLVSFTGPVGVAMGAGVTVWVGVLGVVGAVACRVSPGKWRRAHRAGEA